MVKKKFLITVDTEGDNLWQWSEGQPITTYNANFIPRFQALCEAYSFSPVYLTNLEMAQSQTFRQVIRAKANEGKCEIGMHLHAWNTPPIVEMKRKYSGLPYITEYSKEIMYEKHQYLKTEIEKYFEVPPVTYRSGRWATNETLFSVLDEIGIKVDCSVTPGITMKHCPGMTVSGGNSYVGCPSKPYMLTGKLIEVPLTAKRIRCFKGCSLKNKAGNLLRGKEFWLRPAIHSFEEMKLLIAQMEKEDSSYLEAMIHSSELMPGGSPYGKDQEAIEKIYQRMEQLFGYVSTRYEGITMTNFYAEIKSEL